MSWGTNRQSSVPWEQSLLVQWLQHWTLTVETRLPEFRKRMASMQLAELEPLILTQQPFQQQVELGSLDRVASQLPA